MKIFIITLLVGFGLSLSSYAKEAVAFVTHKIVINSEGKVERVVPMRSELVLPENTATLIKDHYKNMEKAETLFDFKSAMNNAVDKTVKFVSGDTFKKVVKGTEIAVTAAGTAAAVGLGGYAYYTGTKSYEDKEHNKQTWDSMNKNPGAYMKQYDNSNMERYGTKDPAFDKLHTFSMDEDD